MLLLCLVPLPSWPKPLSPHAGTWPAAVSARPSKPPAAIAVTISPLGSFTLTGM